MAITRLSGGLTPADGADPRTFPAIWNVTAGEIEQAQTDIDALEAGTVGGTAVYRYVDTLYYTTAGTATFTKASYPWLRAIKVKMVGGGGGGSGAATTGAGQVSTGGPGAGGGYSEAFYTDIAGLAASVNVVVGAGGAGTAVGGTGVAGGTSSFGSQTATGGGGGTGAGASTPAVAFSNSGTPGSGTNADLIIDGSTGQVAFAWAADRVASGFGGASHLSGTGTMNVPGATGQNGAAGRAYGGGGGPGINAASQATARNGGNGAAGIVIIELYA